MSAAMLRVLVRALVSLATWCARVSRVPSQRERLDKLMPILDVAIHPERHSTEELRQAREQLRGL